MKKKKKYWKEAPPKGCMQFEILKLIVQSTIPLTSKQIDSILLESEDIKQEFSPALVAVSLGKLLKRRLIRREEGAPLECPSCGRGRFRRYHPTMAGVELVSRETKDA